MNLISCETCGVVIDKDRIKFPDIENDDFSIDTDKAIWTGRGYVAISPCPACQGPIPEQGELL